MRIILTFLPIVLLLIAACSGSGNSNSASARGGSDSPPPDTTCTEGCTTADSPAPYMVTLEASQLVHGSSESGSGYGELQIDPDSGAILGTISLTVVDTVQVTLNRGFAGETGPVLAISQRLLGTREIMLIHHTDCGMVTFRDDEVKAQIQADTGLRPNFALEAFPDAEEDVRQSIARIKASPFVPNKDNIRGFVYDVKSGKLNEVVA